MKSLKWKGAFVSTLVTLFLVGCAHNDLTVMTNRKIDGPKVVALDAPQTPWAVQIELQLRKAGFKVLRHSSAKRVTEHVSEIAQNNSKKLLPATC